MGQQVISVNVFGGVSGLQHKPGQGVDLRSFGKVQIDRASEVLWDEQAQQWYVSFRSGSGELLDGVDLTQLMLAQVTPENAACTACADPKARAYFPEYDDAVKAEIAYLNFHRVRGHIPV